MVPPPTYINNLTPHPSLCEAEGPKIKVEEEEALSSPLKSPYLLLGPQTHPTYIAPCLHGCFSDFNYGEIAHYYRNENDSTPFPFKPGFSPYDTLPTPSSCKVVLLNGGKWSNEILSRHELVSWQPCWVVTSAATTQPRLSVSSAWDKSDTQVITFSHGGEDRTSKWEPGSGIVVERYPRFVPRGSLHQVQKGKRVYLTKHSCTRLKVVFIHRGEITSDEDMVRCLRKAKH